MPPPDPSADQSRAAIETALGQIGFCLPGTHHHPPYPVPASPAAHCAATRPSLHGPYIQWTRTVHGKTVTRLLTPAQYQAYAPWFASARRRRAAGRRARSPVPGRNGPGRRLGHDHPGTQAPPRTKLARAQTRPTTQNAGRSARLTRDQPPKNTR